MNDGSNELLTVEEVAELLKVPQSWVYERSRKRANERLPHIKLGKYLRFYRKDVLNYMEGLRRGDPRPATHTSSG